MKFWRFSDIPLIYKIGAAPFFAVLILFAVVAGAALLQERQALVMRGILHDDALQSALATDSQKITADNGALFLIMARQAADGSLANSEKAITKLLAQIDLIKANLVTLRPYLPASQQKSFDDVLTQLAGFHTAVLTVGSMLGGDYTSAAD